MEKREIEHKLEQARKDERAINDNIIKLLEQLAEAEKPKAEKPKLRHGDFGILDDYGLYMVVRCASDFQVKRNEILLASSGGLTQTLANAKVYTDQWRFFGNIFNLMKDWGEDLEEFSYGGVDFKMAKHSLVIDINGESRTITGIDSQMEAWIQFGRLIMTLKKKQSKT